MLTLGKLLAFCGQFVDGQVKRMIVEEHGAWKVDSEQSFGCALCFTCPVSVHLVNIDG